MLDKADDITDVTGITKVYLVEDQGILRESLQAMLELETNIELIGHAETGEEAVETLLTTDVDVVLMNIRLPGIDGLESTRRLKGDLPDLKVIVLTSFDDEHLEEAIESGARGYLLKSCTRRQLVDAINEVAAGGTIIDSSLTRDLVQELIEHRKSVRSQLLTERQIVILEYLASGLRYQEISNNLFISRSTLHREIREVLDRLESKDVTQAVYEAHKRHLI